MENIIAIDVGNGFCKAAILLDPSKDPVSLIPPSMPMGMRSIAYVEPDGTIRVNPRTPPRNCGTVRDVKTHLGKPSLQLTEGGITFSVDPGKVYGAVACELIRLANETLASKGLTPCYRVIVTYPSDFIDTPKPGIMQRSIEELELDGHKLEVVALIPEPAAAAVDTLFYERNIKDNAVNTEHHNIAVCDIGHGTLDVAVVTSTNKADNPFDLICQTGDPDVCGRVIDEKIYADLCRQMGAPDSFTPTARDYKELRFTHAVDIKHELSGSDPVVYKSFLPENGDFTELSLSREALEKMILTDIRHTLEHVSNMLETAKQKGTTVNEIILTGGTSQIPCIQQMLEQVFGSEGITVRRFRPSHAVVNGAARYAQTKALAQYAEYSYGIFSDGSENVHLMINSGAQLTAASAPLSFSPRSSSVQLRVCRSKERSCTADILPYRDCDEVRRFRFDCEAQKSHDVTITIDEDHRLIIECKGPDGKTAKQTSFDHE